MRTQTSQTGRETKRPAFGPRSLALYATGHPRRVLAVWGLMAVIGIGLTGGLLGGVGTRGLGGRRLGRLDRGGDGGDGAGGGPVVGARSLQQRGAGRAGHGAPSSGAPPERVP